MESARKADKDMSSGYNNGGIAPINRINFGDDAQIGVGPSSNYYDTSRIASSGYVQNFDPGSYSFLSKTSPTTAGLNPFQNNFSEQILKYQDDGTVIKGNTIIIA